MFDYRGLTAEELIQTIEYHHDRLRPPIIYWTSEVYSIGRFLRGYAAYPTWLPLYVYAQHGAAYNPVVATHDVENDAEAMLVYNQQFLENFRAASDRPCYLVTMPYVTYRRSHHITPWPEARGSLVFPFHSTMEVDIVFDVAAYARELRALPEKFKPLAVCLHKSDIVKGLHEKFIAEGLPVYTVGDPMDIFFGDRFYDLLRRFKYTMSNMVGSYTYYSVEMGIPFSLFGQAGRMVNVSDPNLPAGEIDCIGTEYRKLEQKMFAGIHEVISGEQKEFVEYVLGVGRGLTGPELKKVLMDAYRKRGGRYLRDTFTAARRRFTATRRRLKNRIMGR